MLAGVAWAMIGHIHCPDLVRGLVEHRLFEDSSCDAPCTLQWRFSIILSNGMKATIGGMDQANGTCCES